MMEKRLQVVASGRVQGVWYRASTRSQAQSLGLLGTVWNRSDGRVEIDFEVFPQAVDALSEVILTLQGDGDYQGVDDLMNEMGLVPPDLQADLDQLDALGIPRDIVFEQGWSVLTGG